MGMVQMDDGKDACSAYMLANSIYEHISLAIHINIKCLTGCSGISWRRVEAAAGGVGSRWRSLVSLYGRVYGRPLIGGAAGRCAGRCGRCAGRCVTSCTPRPRV